MSCFLKINNLECGDKGWAHGCLISSPEMPTLIGRHLYIKSKSCWCTGRQRRHKLTAVSCRPLMPWNWLHSGWVQLGLAVFNWCPTPYEIVGVSTKLHITFHRPVWLLPVPIMLCIVDNDSVGKWSQRVRQCRDAEQCEKFFSLILICGSNLCYNDKKW